MSTLGRSSDLIVTSRSHPTLAGVSVTEVPVVPTRIMRAAPPPGGLGDAFGVRIL